VLAEELPVVGRGQLDFETRYGEWGQVKPRENVREIRHDAIRKEIVATSQIVENQGAAEIVVAAILTTRVQDLGVSEAFAAFEREAQQAGPFLGNEELVQNH
jgi:hypothetical protein